MYISRRKFLKNIFKIGAVTTGVISITPILEAASNISRRSDIVVAYGSDDIEKLVQVAIKNIGGMDRFVKKGDMVVIKPNIGFARTPEIAATTHPEIVKALIKMCYNVGAKRVFVFDHTCDFWKICFKKTGIKEATLSVKGRIFSAHKKKQYKKISIPNGKELKSTHIVKLLLDADVIINVPIAKHHAATGVTLGMKNMMGAVWNRGIFHIKNLHQCIADLSTVIKPTLTVLDATRILLTNGPRGPGKVRKTGEVVVGIDPVAVDAYGTYLFGIKPANIGYINIAYKMGLGEMNLNKIRMKRVSYDKKGRRYQYRKDA
jgi:uncharacterized protein (DUF362 family)